MDEVVDVAGKVAAFRAQRVVRVRGREGFAAPLASQQAAAAVLTAKYRRQAPDVGNSTDTTATPADPA